jgi:hypothetical protein
MMIMAHASRAAEETHNAALGQLSRRTPANLQRNNELVDPALQ